MAKHKSTKPAVKAAKKTAKKTTRKALEISITDKFLEAVKSLGHDADVISKEIKKAGKLVAKKAAEKFKDIKQAVEHTFDADAPVLPKARIKKAVKTVQRVEKRAVKAVAKLEDAVVSAASKAPELLAGMKTEVAKVVKKRTPRKPATAAAKPDSVKTRTPRKRSAAAPDSAAGEKAAES